MYIPTWVDIPIMLLSFMILYEIVRKEFGFGSITDRRLLLMVYTVMWMVMTAFKNQEGLWSVVFLAGSLLSLAGAIYLRLSVPPKLPSEPSFD